MTRGFDDLESLTSALGDLGDLLAERGEAHTLCVIGGAAFLLQEPERYHATADVDVAARRTEQGSLIAADPLPDGLTRAVQEIALIHDLPAGWVNSAAAATFGLILPDGFAERARTYRHGGLLLLIADRQDLIKLKLLAAVQRRGVAGQRHADDLVRAAPTREEIDQASDWVLGQLGDPDAFHERLAQVARELGGASD